MSSAASRSPPPPYAPLSATALGVGAVGNLLEWYDFGLYGLLAPVLAPLFFPSMDPVAALIGAYGGFALGFMMRPLGGAVSTRYVTEPVNSPPTEKPCAMRTSSSRTGAKTPISA